MKCLTKILQTPLNCPYTLPPSSLPPSYDGKSICEQCLENDCSNKQSCLDCTSSTIKLSLSNPPCSCTNSEVNTWCSKSPTPKPKTKSPQPSPSTLSPSTLSPSTFSPIPKKNNKGKNLALAVGLGVGIPIAFFAIVIILHLRKRHI